MAIATLPLGDEVARVAEPTPAWRQDVRIVVWLRGEQDASTAARLAERLAGAASIGEGDIVVDLSEVQFMDAAIVRVLVHCQGELGLQSRQLRLRAPSRFAQRILDLCGLVELIEPVPAVAAGGIGSCVTLRGPG